MPKQAKELSALQVGRLRQVGFHPVGGVPGLGLQISGAARSWLLRFSFEGRRPEMGLGGFPEVPLVDARNRAREARSHVREGRNPIEVMKAAKSSAAAARAASKNFSECAAAFIKVKSPEWANAKHTAQWSTTLETYAEPVIGKLLVADVDTPHIMAILEPIWTEKTETAVRLRGRLENVLDWATVRGFRTGLNPARWRGHLDKLLPQPGKVAKVKHHAALPYTAVPALMQRLEAVEGSGALALRFAILCASRSGEVRGAQWDEVDLDAKLWTIPGERMKTKKEHRVPLSTAAQSLLRAMPASSAFVFPSPRGDRMLSDMTLTQLLRRMEVPAVAHGFRSSFRDWVAEQTNFPRELAEKALAHTLPDAVEAAYQRGDMLEKRRKMMQVWADYCATPLIDGRVIPMRNRAAR